MEAARIAPLVLKDDADTFLIHVAFPPLSASRIAEVGEWHRTDQAGARSRLRDLREEVRTVGDVRVHGRVLERDPADELAEFIRRNDANLVVLGTCGQGFVSRLLTGSVSGKLIRGANCSVLAVPPRAVVSGEFESTEHALSLVATGRA